DGIFTEVELDYHSTEATLKSIREIILNNTPA
ncbi:DsbA family protein, partial [Vibrio sp. D173a]|nr:DsbA family protein [Vibrio sp. D173a]